MNHCFHLETKDITTYHKVFPREMGDRKISSNRLSKKYN